MKTIASYLTVAALPALVIAQAVGLIDSRLIDNLIHLARVILHA